ncbi:MAG: hypothetical protein GF411_11240 [Candidatus Lokiarchaeota archaeon]|nr:hypothetical protein [Candidatus Lokiarchaeota archaeon]
MISGKSGSEIDIDVSMIQVLVGPLGTRVLVLISQGCETPDDIVRFSSISYECLDVKIPLLLGLELVEEFESTYKTTSRGEAYIAAITG